MGLGQGVNVRGDADWRRGKGVNARHHSLFEKLDDRDTYLRAQADRAIEEDRAILAALAGIEKKSDSEAEDG